MGQFLTILSRRKTWNSETCAEAFKEAISKPVNVDVLNFDNQDRKMVKEGTDPAVVTKYLGPQKGNPLTCFKIGVGFVGGNENHSLRLGHAEIVAEEYKRPDGDSVPNATTPLTVVDPLVVQIAEKTKTVDLPAAERFLIHIYFKYNNTTLTLDYEKKTSPLRFYKYVDILRIYTTERMIKHMALKACPDRHSIGASDCASLVRNFISDVMDLLRDPGTPNAEFKKQKDELLDLVHIEDESAGKSEKESRRDVESSTRAP